MLDEIDAAAQDIHRGAKPALNKVTNVLVELNTEFHFRYMKYFEALTECTLLRNATPPKKLKVPDKILKKNLPELTDESYVGVSRRVWNKLVDIHGTDILEAETEEIEASSAEIEPEAGDAGTEAQIDPETTVETPEN
ncbi:MAG: hypothetical protein R3A13_00400 [Bdellovibrionota bacterium]